MTGAAIWTGLRSSIFIAGRTDRERNGFLVVVAFLGGLFAAFFAALISLLVICVIWSMATGGGITGIGGVALRLQEEVQPNNLRSVLLFLVVAATINLAAFAAFVAVAGAVVGRRLREYITATSSIRWRLLLAGLMLGSLAASPMVVIERLGSPGSTALPMVVVSASLLGRAVYVVAASILLLAAAAAEELLIRGWLLRQTAALTRNPAVLIGFTGIVFSLLHVSIVSGHLYLDPGAALTRWLMGAGFAYMTLRLGGIEFSTGAHAANNTLIVLFIEPLSVKAVNAPVTFSYGSIFEYALLAVGYVAITEAVVRSATLRRWTRLSLSDVSPSARTSPAAA